jgi:hypothetical protein
MSDNAITDLPTIHTQVLDQNPWVRIPNGRELAGWTHADEVRYNQHFRQSERMRFFALTFDFLKENGVSGDYFEFGCHSGRTFRMALTEARRHSLDDMRFVAFDSFEGLPEAEQEHGVANWRPAALATSEETFLSLIQDHGIYVDRVSTVKGFYDQSLSPALSERLRAAGRPAALINVDCDLYESSVPVFDFIEPFLQEGTVLYIDDFFSGYKGSPKHGVSRAFDAFRERSRFRFTPHLQVGWFGKSFIAYLDDAV